MVETKLFVPDKSPFYLSIFLATALSCVLVVGLFNWLIDPFGIYQNVKISRLNAAKPHMDVIGKYSLKAICLLADDYKVAILGTSRSNRGISPFHAAFKPKGKTYNTSLVGAYINELDKVVNYIIRYQKQVKLIIFSLDFFTFNEYNITNIHFEQSPFAGKHYFFKKLPQLFTLDEAYYASQTLLHNLTTQSEITSLCHKQGFSTRPFLLPHRHLFTNTLEKFFRGKPLYAGFCYSPKKLQKFKLILQKLHQHQIKAKFYISPVHALQLEALRVANLYPTFEQWKRDLVHIFSDDAQLYSNVAYPLWDFSGYNTITTESIPSDLQPMRWYWESSHFKQPVGDLVIDKVFGYRDESRQIPLDFGILLTSDNIETHLYHTRLAQQQYHQTHSQEVKMVENLANKVLRRENRACLSNLLVN